MRNVPCLKGQQSLLRVYLQKGCIRKDTICIIDNYVKNVLVFLNDVILSSRLRFISRVNTSELKNHVYLRWEQKLIWT